MKVAALMPIRFDPERSLWQDALKQALETCDEVIVLDDRSQPPLPTASNRLLKECREVLRVDGGDGLWSDWVNRMTLLARGAKYECTWALWLDDDQTMGPTLTRARIRALCEQAEKQKATQVSVRLRTAWTPTQWRVDGVYGKLTSVFLTQNPCFEFELKMRHNSRCRFHKYPSLVGGDLYTQDWLVHWGMRTPSIRQALVRKYEHEDPKQEFFPVPYSTLCDSKGIQLKKL